MLQLSLFIAQARLFSSGERHFSAFDLPSIDYPTATFERVHMRGAFGAHFPRDPGAAEGIWLF